MRNLSGLTPSVCSNSVLPHIWWTGSWGAPAADMIPCGNGCSHLIRHLEKVHTPESCFSATFNIDTSGTHSTAYNWKGRSYKGMTWQGKRTMDGHRREHKTTIYFKLLDSASLSSSLVLSRVKNGLDNLVLGVPNTIPTKRWPSAWLSVLEKKIKSIEKTEWPEKSNL